MISYLPLSHIAAQMMVMRIVTSQRAIATGVCVLHSLKMFSILVVIQWNLQVMDMLGTSISVRCSEVVPSSEVEKYGQYIHRQGAGSWYGGCPLFRVSIVRGPTVTLKQ